MPTFDPFKSPRILPLLKYFLISASVYLYIFSAIYLLVEFAHVGKVHAYVLVYATSYVMEYVLTLRVVFDETHRPGKVLKYLIYLAAFFGLSTQLYKSLLSLQVPYLLAIFLTAAALMPLRFLTNKYWVYR
jgi:putative flippase GtrA